MFGGSIFCFIVIVCFVMHCSLLWSDDYGFFCLYTSICSRYFFSYPDPAFRKFFNLFFLCCCLFSNFCIGIPLSTYKSSYSHENSKGIYTSKSKNINSSRCLLILLFTSCVLMVPRILFFLYAILAKNSLVWRICGNINILVILAIILQLLFLLHISIFNLLIDSNMVLPKIGYGSSQYSNKTHDSISSRYNHIR